MVNRACLLCGKRSDERNLRRTGRNSHHTTVLLSSLILFDAVASKRAQKCYDACQKTRQCLCNQHYIDAAHFLASEMACAGMRFTTYVNQSPGVVVPYAFKKDIPSHLVDSIKENAIRLDPELVVTASKVSDFLNFCLSRYPFNHFGGAISASVSEERRNDSTEKPCKSKCEIEAKPKDSARSEFCAPEVVVVGSERLSVFDEKLKEEAKPSVDKQFTIGGDRLLSLFGFAQIVG